MHDFLELIRIEMKRILKTKVYLLFVVAFVVFIASQTITFYTVKVSSISSPNYEDYADYNLDKIQNNIKADTIGRLGYEYTKNSYTVYPYGFYKQISMDENKQQKIGTILLELVGKSEKDISEWYQDYQKSKQVVEETRGEYSINVMKYIPPAVNQQLTWDEFLERMDQVSDLLGKGSNYSRYSLIDDLESEQSYDQALTDYNNLLNKDKIVGAFARLLCDYYGIILAFLPVILGAYLISEDKKNNRSYLIYTKKVSSFHIVFGRYIASLIMIMVPVVICMFIPCTYIAILFKSNGFSVDFLSFAKYAFGWIMPTCMMTLAIGFFLTEIVNGVIAILFQFSWVYTSIFLGFESIRSNVGVKLSPRYNTFGEYHRFEVIFNELIQNRIGYFMASLGLVTITAVVYSLKRRGRWHVRFKYSSNEA